MQGWIQGLQQMTEAQEAAEKKAQQKRETRQRAILNFTNFIQTVSANPSLYQNPQIARSMYESLVRDLGEVGVTIAEVMGQMPQPSSASQSTVQSPAIQLPTQQQMQGAQQQAVGKAQETGKLPPMMGFKEPQAMRGQAEQKVKQEARVPVNHIDVDIGGGGSVPMPAARVAAGALPPGAKPQLPMGWQLNRFGNMIVKRDLTYGDYERALPWKESVSDTERQYLRNLPVMDGMPISYFFEAPKTKEQKADVAIALLSNVRQLVANGEKEQAVRLLDNNPESAIYMFGEGLSAQEMVNRIDTSLKNPQLTAIQAADLAWNRLTNTRKIAIDEMWDEKKVRDIFGDVENTLTGLQEQYSNLKDYLPFPLGLIDADSVIRVINAIKKRQAVGRGTARRPNTMQVDAEIKQNEDSEDVLYSQITEAANALLYIDETDPKHKDLLFRFNDLYIQRDGVQQYLLYLYKKREAILTGQPLGEYKPPTERIIPPPQGVAKKSGKVIEEGAGGIRWD